MLNEWDAMNKGVAIAETGARATHLHAMVSNGGYVTERGDYDWDGLKRGESPFAILQYTVDGLGMLEWEGRRFELGEGVLMTVTVPHAHRYYLPTWSSHWTFLYLCLYGSEVLRLARWFLSQNGPVLRCEPRSSLVRRLRSLYGDIRASDEVDAFQMSTSAYGMICSLCGELGHRSKANCPRIREVVEWMREHLDENIGIETLAQRAGYSKYHFTRLYTRYAGIPPREHLERMRIQEAVGLLRNHRCRIREAAEAVGYPDPNYFSKVFRRVTGHSPTEFLQQGL